MNFKVLISVIFAAAIAVVGCDSSSGTGGSGGTAGTGGTGAPQGPAEPQGPAAQAAERRSPSTATPTCPTWTATRSQTFSKTFLSPLATTAPTRSSRSAPTPRRA